MREWLLMVLRGIGILVVAVAVAIGALLVLTRTALGAELPPGWAFRFVPIATVDDPDRGMVRHILAEPGALAEARPGAPLPPGTLVVMAEARAATDTAGRPLRDAAGRFVAEPGWTAILAQRKTADGAWLYAAFDGDGRPRAARAAACAACHQAARAAEDESFHLWDHVQARR